MFAKTKRKLDEARAFLDEMEASSDPQTFQRKYGAFLASCYSIKETLEREGAEVDDFKDWYDPQQRKFHEDELLNYVMEARNNDVHGGNKPTVVQELVIDNLTINAGPGERVTIGPDGIKKTVNTGTPRERTFPYEGPGSWAAKITARNPPTKHRGRRLGRNDPVTIAKLVLRHFENLIHNAREKFE